MNEAVLRIEGLEKSFGNLEVLKGIDLTIHKGEVVCIIGASGSGKSTLLRCVNLLEEADAGSIWFDGQDLMDLRVDLNALRQISPIRTMTASTYQAVSGAGAEGPLELAEEVRTLLRGEKAQPKVFPYQIAYNVIPQIGSEQESGYTSEEMKLQYEGRKILHLPDMKVSCTCVRVPVVRSHSISLALHFDRPISVHEARAALRSAPGCVLVDDLAKKQYPMPLDTSDQDLVFVGRIRPDLTDENGLCLWCCGDQVRKGAATNAIQIAELLIDRTPDEE